MRLSFGIKTSQMGLTYQDILPVWRDPSGSRCSGTPGSGTTWSRCAATLRGATLEAWTLLGALAAQTQRLRLGVMVTSNRLRPPAVAGQDGGHRRRDFRRTAGLRDRRGRQPATPSGAGRTGRDRAIASSRPSGSPIVTRPARRSAALGRGVRADPAGCGAKTSQFDFDGPLLPAASGCRVRAEAGAAAPGPAAS